jgi:hypothetical protein
MDFFELHELVDKPTWERLGENSIWMLNEKAVNGLIALRIGLDKPIAVNNYFWGGNLSNRGYRSIYSTVGGKFSQHRVGNAFDINVKGMTADQVYDYRTHIDFRTTNLNTIKIVKP